MKEKKNSLSLEVIPQEGVGVYQGPRPQNYHFPLTLERLVRPSHVLTPFSPLGSAELTEPG